MVSGEVDLDILSEELYEASFPETVLEKPGKSIIEEGLEFGIFGMKPEALDFTCSDDSW